MSVLQRCSQAAGRWQNQVAHLFQKQAQQLFQKQDLAPSWVFLGPPGVGKGTYCSRISEALGIPHIAAGDLVRDEISNKTDVGLQVCLLSSSRYLCGFETKQAYPYSQTASHNTSTQTAPYCTQNFGASPSISKALSQSLPSACSSADLDWAPGQC